ncbi:MAG: MraY family glycosyltransferase, partial [Candidatus Peribacteraceae bacterium]|nr:MraY family glycosyltransferase [Candidatus Peribacteraceae bacterium]
MSSGEQLLWLPLHAFIACGLLHLIALRLFPRWNLLDFPQRYGLTRQRLPYPTGIVSAAVFLCFFAALSQWSRQNTGILLGILLITLTAFFDDRRPLPAVLRLGMQLLGAFLIFATGTHIFTITNPILTNGIIKLDTIRLPLAYFGNPPLLSGIFTVCWLLLTTNALNWFDGVPGQVSLLSTIGFLTIGFLAISPRIAHLDPALQQHLALIAFVLAGISIAGLLFDFPPNRVLMGDTGAMFFGLMLGILTIYAGGKVATAFLVLGVPLIDSFIVILRRIAHGRSPLHGSPQGEHLHHLLLARGWSQQRIVLLTALLGTAFGIAALFLSTREKFFAALLLL